MSSRMPDTPHLLLVEDSETQALQIRRVLERAGFTVSRAASAEAALDRLNRDLPDLVVSDYHLPGMNGGELARALRLNVRTQAIPVLMLTEASEPGLEREGLDAGADAYVPKSAETGLIVLRIRALLRQRGAQPGSPSLAPEAAAPGFGEGVGLFRRARILLVRDPDADEALATLLARDGHRVHRAAGPAEASPLLDAAPDGFDCVVVDLQARGFDGIGVCAGLDRTRQQALQREARRVPPAAAGGGPAGAFRILGLGDSDPTRAYDAGVDDVVSAVAGTEAVALRIRAVVRRKLLQDETARIEGDLRQRQAEIDRAREEVAASAAKAALAEALADANDRLREAQGKLVQAAKMASLGELVAGIAHEINNPLAFILAHQGTVERLLAQLAELPGLAAEPAAAKLNRSRERIAAMSLGLRRIQNLVLNLRKFSRLDESEQQSVDVPDSIDTVLALLTHKLGTGITVSRRYDAPRELLCQPALLNQVIMNIVGNAADALNAQGFGDAAPREGRIDITTTAADGVYAIAIGDNGPGVPDGLRERVFEPFFTTKPVGSGTGLGLAIAYTVVQAHGGTIAIDDVPDGGARFTVSVPIPQALAP